MKKILIFSCIVGFMIGTANGTLIGMMKYEETKYSITDTMVGNYMRITAKKNKIISLIDRCDEVLSNNDEDMTLLEDIDTELKGMEVKSK